MPWRWFQDWRDRRSALAELEERWGGEEGVLMDQSQNPIYLAKRAVTSDNLVEAASQWERALLLMPNGIVESPDSLDILLGLKRYDEANALMRERQKRFAGDRFCLMGLARTAEARGDIAEALKRWEVVRSRVRNNIEGFH